jgi:glycerophosphoryl diester phosphodiesterase
LSPAFPPPRVIGHRGAAAYAPENTLAGFRLAHDMGVRWVEFDVQASRDGVPFLFHDARLERTTDGAGIACEKTAAALDKLDAGRWFAPKFRGERVPHLEAALDLLAALGMGANLEIKPAPGDGRRTVLAALPVLRGFDPARLVLSSFDEDALAVVAAEAPEIPRALLVKTVPPDWEARTNRFCGEALHVGDRGLTAAAIAEVARVMPVRVYTVNTRARARDLFGWGAAAVFTDCPDVIVSAIGQRTELPAVPRLAAEKGK